MKQEHIFRKTIWAAALSLVPALSFAQASAQDDFKVALAARQVGDHDSAFVYASKAVHKEPWVAAHHSVAIYAAVQSGRFSVGQCEVSTLEQINPADPELKEVLKACGFAFRENGNISSALSHYEAAKERDPNDSDTQRALDMLKASAQAGEQKAQSRQIRVLLADLKANPSLTDEQVLWVYAATVPVEDKILVLSTAGRHQAAVALAAQNSKSTLKPYGIHALGRSYSAQKNHVEAQKAYESLMQREDVELEVITELFYVYTDSHQYSKAQELITDVQSRFKGNQGVKDVALRLQSKLLAWSGNADAAVKIIKENSSAETAAMVVPQLQAGERPRKAIVGFENQLVQSPNNSYVKLDKARAHIQLRELTRAEVEIQEVQSKSTAGMSPTLVEKASKALESARKPGVGTSVRIQKEEGEKGSKTVNSNTYAYMSSGSGLLEGTIDVGTVLEEIPDIKSRRYETLSVSGNAKFRYGEVSAGFATDSERSTLSPILGVAAENDYIRASLSVRTNNQSTGARARAANVSSSVINANLNLKATSRLSLSAVGSLEKFSDTNRRQRVGLTTSYAVYSSVDSRLSAYTSSFVTSNSTDAVVYYAPLRLKSNLVGLKASKDFNFIEKRLTVGLDAYVGRQDELKFGDAVVGGAVLSVDFATEAGFGLSLYAGADQRVYDGNGVVDFKGGLNVSGKF